jgi:tyrosyl-tRNA synthetase
MNTDSLSELLTRGVTNIISNKEELLSRLTKGDKLNIYLGIEPTATRIHIGHAVPLRKLHALSQMGHNVTFLIGGFTALIGDTSDKESERPILTSEEISENLRTYKKQAEKILDFSNIVVKNNSEWLSKLTFTDIIKLAQHFSVGEFVGRELIKRRLQDGKHVRLDEALYPVMQGYDSYYMDTDIQIGGADQTFNMQAGRTLQKDLRGKDTFVLVTDYLLGTDGKKMSKSQGNAIWLTDTPDDMYGKVMSLTDENIIPYFLMATNTPLSEIEEYKSALSGGDNPMSIKKVLAHTIVNELHNETDANTAQEKFESTFQNKEADFDTPVEYADTLAKVLVNASMSASEAKRLIQSGAVDINSKTVTNPQQSVSHGDKIKVGKRIFLTVS